MHRLRAVFKREVKAYFSQPIAYVMMAGSLLILGFFYYRSFDWFSGVSDKTLHNPLFARELDLGAMVVGATMEWMGVVSVLTLPLLTMRLWAEERHSGTVELLLTLPLREHDIVFGKFLAALSVYAILLACTLLYALLTALFGSFDPGPVLSGYMGTLFLGAALLSLGFLCSTWAESQMLAGAVAWMGFLFFWFVGHAADFVGGKLGTLLTHLSFANHHDNFVKGRIETQDIAFFLLFSLFCLVLTIRSVESTRWRG